MGFTTKRIKSMFVQTNVGEVALSGKSGEDPELKIFTDSIEDSDDGMTNDGQLIINSVKNRSYISGVFGYSDADIPFIKDNIQSAIANGAGQPCNCVMDDGSIYSNIGVFVGDVVYNGTGTQELKFAAAQDWIPS